MNTRTPIRFMLTALLLAAMTPLLVGGTGGGQRQTTQSAPGSDRLETHPLLAAAGGAQADLTLLRAHPGSAAILPADEQRERYLYVLQGAAAVTCDGVELALGGGDAAWLPPATTAAVAPAGLQPFEAVEVMVQRAPSRPDGPMAVHAADAPIYAVQDGRLLAQILLDGEDRGVRSGALTVLTAHDGAARPPHEHGETAELIFVLEGSVSMTLGDSRVTLGPRTALWIPGGTHHSVKVDPGQGPMRAVQVYLPGGPEQRFKAGERVNP